MIFSGIGEIAEGFYALGTPGYPVYLLDSERPVLFDAGLAHLAPIYAEHAKSILGERKPAYLLHTHLHYDHCGSTHSLEQVFPGLIIGASQQGAEIIARPGAVKAMAQMSESARLEFGGDTDTNNEECRFKPFSVGLILGDGDKIRLEEKLSIEVFATPGHTRDFLSYYIPERKILISSEATGCAVSPGMVLAQFVSDYDQYFNSLKKMSALDVQVVCQGHIFAFTGGDVKTFFNLSLNATSDCLELIEKLLQEENGDLANVLMRLKESEWDKIPDKQLPEEAYMANAEARVRQIAARWELKKK